MLARCLNEGKENINDDLRSGHSISEFTDEHNEPVRKAINDNIRSTYDGIIDEASFFYNKKGCTDKQDR